MVKSIPVNCPFIGCGGGPHSRVQGGTRAQQHPQAPSASPSAPCFSSDTQLEFLTWPWGSSRNQGSRGGGSEASRGSLCTQLSLTLCLPPARVRSPSQPPPPLCALSPVNRPHLQRNCRSRLFLRCSRGWPCAGMAELGCTGRSDRPPGCAPAPSPPSLLTPPIGFNSLWHLAVFRFHLFRSRTECEWVLGSGRVGAGAAGHTQRESDPG